MTRQIVMHTSQAYVLSLNIISQNDNGLTFSTVPIVRVTSLIFAIFTVMQWLNRQWLKIQSIPQAALALCESFYLLVEACRKPMRKTYAVNYRGALWAT